MSWSSSDARARRPWLAGASLVVMFALLAPTSSSAGCADETVVSACVERTRVLAGIVMPTSLHPALWLLAGLAAGTIAWLAVTAVVRRAARIERDDLVA